MDPDPLKTLRPLALGLAALLALGALAPLAAAQEEPEPAPGADVENDHSKKCRWLRLCRSPKHFPPGEFNESSGFVSGRYLELTYDARSGAFLDVAAKFSRRGETAVVPFFDRVALAPFDAANATLAVNGSKLTVKGEDTMYVAHDVRRSMVGAAARNGDYVLAFDLADGCESKAVRRGVAVTCAGVHGLIAARGRDNVTVGNGTVTVELDDGGAGAFSLVPPKSHRLKAWMREHGDELRERAREHGGEHADEMRDRASDHLRDHARDAFDRPRDRDGEPENETAAS